MSDTISLKRYDEDGKHSGWKNATEILNEAYGGKENVPDSKGAYIRVQTIDERGYRYRPIGVMFSCSQRYSNRDFKRGTKAKKPRDSYNYTDSLSAETVKEKYEEVLEEALKEQREREESRARAKKARNRKQEIKEELKDAFEDMSFHYSSKPFDSEYSDSERLEAVPMKLIANSKGVDVELSNMTVEESRLIAEYILAMRS